MHITRNNKKSKSASFMATTALGLTLVAGMPATVNAGPDHKTDHNKMTNAEVNERLLQFVKSNELIGTEMFNRTGDEIGTMSDYIVDRGSGQIAYAIVKTGDILGFGGKEVALDYNQLRFNAASISFRTDMSQSELERQTEFTPTRWDDLSQTNWMDNLGNWIDGDEGAAESENTLRTAVREGETRAIEGEITRISREDVMGEEYVCATITDADNNKHKVLVGPSWFLNSEDYSLQREDDAQLRVVEYENDRWIAVQGEINSRQVQYRDNDGNGRWNDERSADTRYVLLSELTGDSVEIAGSTVGEVQSTVIEGSSGQIAFIGFDPNENLFGLGDEISLVPWTSLSMVNDTTLSLDSNEAELSRATVMPEAFDTMRTRSSVRSAYKVFDQELPKFKHRDKSANHKMHDKKHDEKRDSWKSDDDG